MTETEREYGFDLAWEQERERLAAVEHMFDERTQRLLDSVGVTAGWRCLEVGAGGGTTASWLCERVGATGQVVATDMDTRFVDRLEHPNLRVLRHDITCDPLEDCAFDLIHSRMLLEHLALRDHVVRRLVQALKPGGWLMIEDVDMTSALYVPADAWFAVPEDRRELVLRVHRALRDVVTSFGADLEYGARLPSVLMACGLEDVDAEMCVRLVRGGTARAEWSRLTMEVLRDALAQILTADELEEAFARHHDPGTAWMSFPLVTAWGRRPA
jgi:SAM-dependent methyltransferase